MLIDHVEFGPLDYLPLWDLGDDPHPINTLRRKRSLIGTYQTELANREDETDFRLQRDHAVLSSLTFLYTLNLIHVILIHAYTIRPNRHLADSMEIVSHTLTTIKGVFHHVENRWFGADV